MNERNFYWYLFDLVALCVAAAIETYGDCIVFGLLVYTVLSLATLAVNRPPDIRE